MGYERRGRKRGAKKEERETGIEKCTAEHAPYG